MQTGNPLRMWWTQVINLYFSSELYGFDPVREDHCPTEGSLGSWTRTNVFSPRIFTDHIIILWTQDVIIVFIQCVFWYYLLLSVQWLYWNYLLLFALWLIFLFSVKFYIQYKNVLFFNNGLLWRNHIFQ